MGFTCFLNLNVLFTIGLQIDHFHKSECLNNTIYQWKLVIFFANLNEIESIFLSLTFYVGISHETPFPQLLLNLQKVSGWSYYTDLQI